MENLGINSKFMSEEPASNELVTDIIKKIQNHPSIIKIMENHPGQNSFSFSAIEVEDVVRETGLLDTSKIIAK